MSYKKFILLTLLLTPLIANAATCPPVSLIKSVTFDRAEVYDESDDIWELISAPFDYDGKKWDVSYGLYITNAANPADALLRGQQRYPSEQIIHDNPPADPIPGFLFCDYTSTNMVYWIQAMTPPGE